MFTIKKISQRISENFGNASNPVLGFLENSGNSSKVFSRCFYYFSKFLENFRKSLEVFGSIREFRKTSETVQKCFPDVLLIFENFPNIFGNLRKCSKKIGNGSKVIFRCFYDFLKFSENLRESSEVFAKSSGNFRT